jgi:DNA-binding response OmpR family regulator
VKKILIVDDDRTLSDTTAEVLREHGYEVIAAYDGYGAIRLAMETIPQLIILDIMMPAGGGLGVYDSLQHSSVTQNIPVIFTTGKSPDEVSDKLSPRAMKNFVTKPYNIEELVARIEKLIGA